MFQIILNFFLLAFAGYTSLAISNEKEYIFSVLVILIIYLIYKMKNNNIYIKNCLLTKKFFFILLSLYLLRMLTWIVMAEITSTAYISSIANKEEIIVSLVTICILFPIIEELIFRDFLLKKLSKLKDEKTALILSSILFAFFHLDSIFFIYYLWGGLFYGYFYLKSKNIFLTIILHSLTNLGSMFNSFYQYSLFTFIFIVIYFLILLFSISLFKTRIKKL